MSTAIIDHYYLGEIEVTFTADEDIEKKTEEFEIEKICITDQLYGTACCEVSTEVLKPEVLEKIESQIKNGDD